MRLSITTPRGALVDIDADELTAPGVMGEFGVLPGHVPMLTALAPGVLTYKGQGHKGTVAVGDGFLEVAPLARQGGQGDRVLVLVIEALHAADIDRAAADKEAAQADAELAAWKGETGGELQALRGKRAWAQARVDAAARGAAH